VYEVTYAPVQMGGSFAQTVMPRLPVKPLHAALPPSMHLEKPMQQPGVAQSQVPRSAKTEWQSVRASHAASVVTLSQKAGHDAQATGSPGTPHPRNLCPPLQLGQ
jgi:hypothetical protein